MPTRIELQGIICRYQAERAAEKAQDHTLDAITRQDWHEAHLCWCSLVEVFALAQRLSGYIEWQSRRVSPPPDFDEMEVGEVAFAAPPPPMLHRSARR